MKRLSSFLFCAFFFASSGISGSAQAPSNNEVRGTVVDEKGAAVSGAFVCAIRPTGPGPTDCTYSRSDGSFVLVSRQTGDFLLAGEKMQDHYFSSQLLFFRSPSVALTPVTIGGTAPPGSVVVRLPPKNGFLVGKVVDESTGLPVDDVRFKLCHAERPSVCHAPASKNADGSFRLPAPHVAFTVRVIAKHYETWTGTRPGEAELTVPPGEEVERTIALKRKPAYVGMALHESEKRKGMHLPAPVQLTPADSERTDRYPRTTRFEWESVPGAHSYIVEFDFCNGRLPASRGCVDPQPWRTGTTPAVPESPSHSLELNFVGAQPGRWRVVALDEKGIEGFKSPWRIIFYSR